MSFIQLLTTKNNNLLFINFKKYFVLTLRYGTLYIFLYTFNKGPKTQKWLLNFYNDIMSKQILPKVFKKAKIIAISKPGKDPSQPESYRPIALLCVCYKIFEKIIYARLLESVKDIIPPEQAGFMPGRNCCDQALALTTFIENGFEKKLKTAVAFIDLTCAYDTVWKEGLLLKLHKLVPCRTFSRLINEMMSDRLFQVHLNGKRSRFRTLQNGLPQGSTLSPLLFNIYTSDVPPTTSRKFIYADDTTRNSIIQKLFKSYLTASLNSYTNTQGTRNVLRF